MQMELELPGLKRVKAATAPMKASTQEIGYAQAVISNWWLYEDETTPELRWPQSVSVFDAMRRTDAQVASVLRAVNLPIRRTPWRIDPNGARATVVKFVANDLGLPIVGKPAPKAPARSKGKFSWQEHLRLALLELVYGHMFFEQVYEVNASGTEAHLKKLAPRMPKTIREIAVAADGGLVSITQWWTTMTREPQPIPVGRLVAYVHDREGGNWLGQSILRPAYKNWLIKDRLLRVQAQTIERNGMGIPLYKAQEGASTDDLAAGKSMATAWRAGEAAGSAVPFGADLILRGVEGTLPDADPAIRYHDEQIARAVLAHFLNLGTQTGSWALGATFADFFVFSLQTLAQQLADVTTQHVIEDLVDVNFGPDEPAPKLVFDEIGSQQAATAQALKLLVDAGVIHPDQILEESSRQQYGLPAADPATATPPPGTTTPTGDVPAPTSEMPGSVAAKRRSRRPVKARYDPAQKRDPNGKWGDGIPGPGLGEVIDAVDHLGLDGDIELDPREHLGTTDGIDDDLDEHRLNYAVVTSPIASEVRIGIALIEPDPGEARWNGDDDGRTAILDTEQLATLRGDVAAGARTADADAARADAAWATGKAPTDPRLLGSEPIAEGKVTTEWTDLSWSIFLNDEEPTSWNLQISTQEADINFSAEKTAFVLGELAKVERELRAADAANNDGPVHAAADTHPGGEELKHYWVYGEGAAKWATWTELYDHLKTGKGLTDEQAKRIAASWFHLRYGIWPGDHRNDH